MRQGRTASDVALLIEMAAQLSMFFPAWRNKTGGKEGFSDRLHRKKIFYPNGLHSISSAQPKDCDIRHMSQSNIRSGATRRRNSIGRAAAPVG